ncbi:hypothetical protein [Rhizobium sp. SL86]|uniref:hypothetical protein n=1 Tax=Rhizobium sp. SL86 TaxID=2995148 RepID=UPI0022764339|nr:hypothetical protein [Rhizobium sp. SL86]MCY1668490.1 hypothetical protein [Rhizobium sp. SL86]
MKIVYKLNLKQGLKADTQQQDDALQTMLDWKKSKAPEFSATLRLYLSARRFLRSIQEKRLLMLTLLTGAAVQDVALLVV